MDSSHQWSQPVLDATFGAAERSTCVRCGCVRIRHLSGAQRGFKRGGRVYDDSRTTYSMEAGFERWLSMPGPCRGKR